MAADRMTFDTFKAKVWRLLAAAWPRAHDRLDPETADAAAETYFAAVVDFSLGEVLRVARILIRTGGEWMPAPAALYRRLAADRDAAPPWSQAWDEARSNAAEPIQTNSPPLVWSHPAVRLAAREIGLWEIANTKNPATIRAQFRAAYETEMAARLERYAAGDVPLPPARPAVERRRAAEIRHAPLALPTPAREIAAPLADGLAARGMEVPSFPLPG